MKKLLSILLIIICLKISVQLQCSQYQSGYCGDFNDGFTLKCQKFSTCLEVQVDSGCKIENDKCVKNDNNNEKEICKFYDVYVLNPYPTTLKMCKKVLIDDGCKVTDNYNCEAADSSSKVKCEMNEDNNHCQKFDKECTDYSDTNCGGLKTEVKTGVTQQCIKLPDYNCLDITIDEYCKVTENGDCEPRSNEFDETKYKCELNMNLEKPECKRRAKVCTELDAPDKCEQITNCKAINLGGKTCKLVTIDSPTCKIDNDGNCVIDKGNNNYQNCEFNADGDGNYKCQASTKFCSEIENTNFCENGATKDNNNECKVLTIGGGDKCVEVKTHTSCKIDNKQCEIKTESATQACKLDNIANEYYCQFYQKDPECDTGTDFSECKISEKSEDKKCVPLNDNTECRVKDKVCSDYYDSTKCENANIGTNKKCSWDSSLSRCKEYEIDDICTVTGGICGVKSGKTESNKMKCLFTNSTEVICKQIEDTCKNYYANCDSHDRTSEKIQCVSSGFQLNCKEVKIDDDCHVDNNNDCVPKDISKIDTNTQGCYDNEEKTECKIRNKECKEYSTQPTCNANNKCSYISDINENYNFCYETETENDQVCKIVNNECTKASDSSINSDKEKCLFVYDQDKEKAICKKVEKLCNEISKNDVCNSVSTNSYKCHYLSGKCLNITLDGNCTMNNADKCVENGSGKLSATDMCELTTSSIYYSGQCYKREKTCSDITVLNECNSYQPVNRKCFYISSSDSSTCKEIKVDSQCSINDNNECTGNGCSFENDKKDHCAYKNNGSSILKIRMLILALFFML